jgi:hypothetical protein
VIAVHAEYFSCPTCHLVLDDYELIVQAGLPDSFEFVDEDRSGRMRSRSTATTEKPPFAGSGVSPGY